MGKQEGQLARQQRDWPLVGATAAHLQAQEGRHMLGEGQLWWCQFARMAERSVKCVIRIFLSGKFSFGEHLVL